VLSKIERQFHVLLHGLAEGPEQADFREPICVACSDGMRSVAFIMKTNALAQSDIGL
jgi:hypothetical protein